MPKQQSVFSKIKRRLVGQVRSPLDRSVFHNLSLIAFFAWVGLGADGLSSSCYGPEEAFLALGSHHALSLFLALATALTVFIISSSYSQIIELFPSGGGGYLVASKLLSPTMGMVSGCALLIDYVLTIAISVACGADAVFSFLPPGMHAYKLEFAVFGVLFLTTLNLRGVKESVTFLVPIFLAFLATHIVVIVYALVSHLHALPAVVVASGTELARTKSDLGFWGLAFLLMRAYSLGAGTYTGIEAVSNGLPILREPKVKTGKKTMQYMAISLSLTVAGLMIAYLLYGVTPVPGKTLNAVLVESMTAGWGTPGRVFWLVTLLSEALLLFVAAQAGFLDGPRVLANMALDRWFPTKFAALSDRLVTEKGIFLMGGAALVTVILSKGSVKFLVVLYSINVFITFCLSQAGMVRHWMGSRAPGRKRKLLINGIGFTLCFFILTFVTILKFHDGGWITILITGSLVVVAIYIKKHYLQTVRHLHRLNDLLESAASQAGPPPVPPAHDPKAKTAVVLVNGYNGLGLHTLFNVIRLFGNEFRNFVFVQVGVVDAGNFKGAEEVDNLTAQIKKDVARYVDFMHRQGRYAEGLSYVGVEVIAEMEKIGPEIRLRYPNAVFFGGQLVFPKESVFNRWLHNYTVFAMQQRFYQEGIPFVILPIRVDDRPSLSAT